ncbi:hypothetical protein C8J56DRAFT_818140 [Mycena floridula]|nr:hypothetical protein C8J56DRAFT_818140 [Mycena floridula]
MPMSDYDLRPGGSLKLKGVAEGGIVKKKKKKSKAKADVDREKEQGRMKELLKSTEVEIITSPGSGRNSPATEGSSSSRKTEAERRFEEVQKKRLAQRVAKTAGKTHKDRVSEFNAHLESLSEHHDIPKVGPG